MREPRAAETIIGARDEGQARLRALLMCSVSFELDHPHAPDHQLRNDATNGSLIDLKLSACKVVLTSITVIDEHH